MQRRRDVVYWVRGRDLYSELSNLSGLSVYLVQVNGSVEIEALGGGLCGFSGEVVVYPTLSVPEFSGACADAVPDVGEAYRIVTYALDTVPDGVLLVGPPDDPDDGGGGGDNPDDDDDDGGRSLAGLYGLIAIPVVGALGLCLDWCICLHPPSEQESCCASSWWRSCGICVIHHLSHLPHHTLCVCVLCWHCIVLL